MYSTKIIGVTQYFTGQKICTFVQLSDNSTMHICDFPLYEDVDVSKWIGMRAEDVYGLYGQGGDISGT